MKKILLLISVFILLADGIKPHTLPHYHEPSSCSVVNRRLRMEFQTVKREAYDLPCMGEPTMKA